LIVNISTRKRFLFMCGDNALRSQIAEAFARMVAGDRIEVYSAGKRAAAHLHPQAIAVMRESGYDLTKQRPKSLPDIPDLLFDVAVSMELGGSCPLERARKHLAWKFPEPKEATLKDYQAMRDMICDKVQKLLSLELSPRGGDESTMEL